MYHQVAGVMRSSRLLYLENDTIFGLAIEFGQGPNVSFFRPISYEEVYSWTRRSRQHIQNGDQESLLRRESAIL